jgi:hypothetical protein
MVKLRMAAIVEYAMAPKLKIRMCTGRMSNPRGMLEMLKERRPL